MIAKTPSLILNKLNNDCMLPIIKYVADDEDKDDRRANLRNLSRSCTEFCNLTLIELHRDLHIGCSERVLRKV